MQDDWLFLRNILDVVKCGAFDTLTLNQ